MKGDSCENPGKQVRYKFNETKPSIMCKIPNQAVCYCKESEEGYTEICGTCKTTLVPSKTNTRKEDEVSTKAPVESAKSLFIKFLKRLKEKKSLKEKEWALLDQQQGEFKRLCIGKFIS